MHLLLAANHTIAAPILTNYALFVGGNNGSAVNTTQTYKFDTAAVAPGVNLSTTRYYGAAVGNYSVAVFGTGYSNNSLDSSSTLYTYSSSVFVTGSAIAGRSYYGMAAAGNASVGVFACGAPVGGGGVKSTSYYTYSSNTVSSSSGATVTNGRYALSACGNSTDGYFMSSLTSSPSVVYYKSVDIYNYAGNTVSAGTNLVSSRPWGAAFSSPTIGIMAGGFQSGSVAFGTTEKYTFATNVVAVGTALSVARNYHAGCSSSTTGVGVIGGGWGSSSTPLVSMDVYNLSSGTVTAGSNAAGYTLPQSLRFSTATSSNPGGF